MSAPRLLRPSARRALVPAIAVVVALGAAACSGSSDSGSSTSGPVTSEPSGTEAPASSAAPTSATPTDPCTGATGSITVYSGRNETLVGQLLTDFTTATGVKVEARYGDSGELAGQMLTEGEASPADAFFSQDAGALGALEQAELLAGINPLTLERVAPAYRSSAGKWVGTSGRVRVIVYNPSLAPNPPTTIDELVKPEWKGKIGFAPTNASWQSFVTALRVVRGEDGARTWLEAFAANDPKPFEKNAAVRDAVNAGDVALGLVNHYYLYELIAAEGADKVVAKNQFLAPGDVGGLVNVAGVGVLSSSDNAAAAQCFASYLLSDAAQQYFVTKTFEYPLVPNIEQAADLPVLSDLRPPAVDLSDLRSIAETQELLASVGLLTR